MQGFNCVGTPTRTCDTRCFPVRRGRRGARRGGRRAGPRGGRRARRRTADGAAPSGRRSGMRRAGRGRRVVRRRRCLPGCSVVACDVTVGSGTQTRQVQGFRCEGEPTPATSR